MTKSKVAQTIFISILFGITHTHSAFSQTALRGIKDIGIQIGQLDKDAKECGIDESAIRKAVAHPLANSGLQIGPTNSTTVLYVQVTVLPLKNVGMCATATDMSLNSYQVVEIEATHMVDVAPVTLWQHNRIGVSARGRHRSQTLSQVEEMTKSFMADWAAAQN